MLKEEVDEEDIARIVSKWTGIPVSKMLEGEVKKLVTHGRPAAAAGDWAGCGAGAGGECDPAVARGAERSEAADWVVYLPGADGRGQNRTGAGAGGVSV